MASPTNRVAQDHPGQPSAMRARRPSADRAGCTQSLFAETCAAATKQTIADRVALGRCKAGRCRASTTRSGKLEKDVSFSPAVSHGLNFAIAHVVHLDGLAFNT